MNLKFNKIIKYIIFIIWVIVFFLSFKFKNNIIHNILYIISFYYIIELIYLFIIYNNKKDFFKNYWFDIILLLPIFKVFKLFKHIKIIKKILSMKIHKKLIEILDIISKLKELYKEK